MDNENAKKLYEYYLHGLIICMVISLIVIIADNCFGLTVMISRQKENDFENTIMDFYLVSIQVAFTVLALSTVLSQHSKRVYWTEMYKYKLVRPISGCFKDLSGHLLAALSVGFVIFLLDQTIPLCLILGLLICASLSLYYTVRLSWKMIEANFGKEEIKKKLQEDLEEDKKEYLQLSYDIGAEAGRRLPKINELLEKTIQELDQKEFELVVENMILLCEMGFLKDFAFVYDYAENTFEDEKLIDLIINPIMHWAVYNNKDSIFYSENPIPFERQVKWWNELIDIRFDEAVVLWTENKQEAAMTIRKDLYKMLINVLVYQYIKEIEWFETNGYHIPKNKTELTKFKQSILEIMAKFVARRHNDPNVTNMDGDINERSGKWEKCEDDGLEEHDRENLEILRIFAKETLDELSPSKGDPMEKCVYGSICSAKYF